MSHLCPGSLGFLQPKIEVFKCPDCSSDVEIWSDEGTGPCLKCGKTVVRTAGQSCIDWCKFAKQCLGEDKFKQYGEMKANMRKEAIVKAMEEYFGSDSKRIKHAKAVATYAETILSGVKGNANLVLAAAILHDIGIKNAEAKYKSADPSLQEQEGPPVAMQILKKLDYPDDFIKEVCDIIGHHHHPRDDESENFKIVFDADLIANSEKQIRRSKCKGLPEEIERMFLTSSGKEVARNL